MFRPGRGRQPSIAIFLLLNELFQAATTSGIPPVTGLTILVQILIFLRFIKVPWTYHYDVCLDVTHVVRYHQWIRLIASVFEHADDWHLYYNMISFLWKGKTLEARFKSLKFLYILIVFTLACNATYIGLYYLLAQVTGDYKYYNVCAIGFSGVIFALKVLTTYYWPVNGYSSMYGIPFPARHAVWAELIFIQMVTPNASFIGHLSGILVGLAFVQGPLKYFIDSTYGFVTSWFDANSYRNAYRRASPPPSYSAPTGDYSRYQGSNRGYGQNWRRYDGY